MVMASLSTNVRISSMENNQTSVRAVGKVLRLQNGVKNVVKVKPKLLKQDEAFPPPITHKQQLLFLGKTLL